jgi:uncharacterized protein (TIGR03083 family)
MANGWRYRLAHDRVVALVAALPDDMAVPSTPAWNLRELLAHLAGAAVDLAGGNAIEWSLPQWTEAQVRQRATSSRQDLLDEWAAAVDGVVERVDAPEAFGLYEAFTRMPVIDVVGHEHDIAEAAGQPAAIETDDWFVLHEHRRAKLDETVTAAGLAPLLVTTPEGDRWTVGGDDPVDEVVVPRHELWRSLTGRRRRSDVTAYAWSCDPGPYVRVWVGGTFSWPVDDDS